VRVHRICGRVYGYVVDALGRRLGRSHAHARLVKEETLPADPPPPFVSHVLTGALETLRPMGSD
jgi:hypothetical protein